MGAQPRVAWEAAVRGKAAASFLGMWPVRSPGALAQKGPAWGLMLCCGHLETSYFWNQGPRS